MINVTPEAVEEVRRATDVGAKVVFIANGSDMKMRDVYRLSVASYRKLMEAGAEIWELQGQELHAKLTEVSCSLGIIAFEEGSNNFNLRTWTNDAEMGQWVADVAAHERGSDYITRLQGKSQRVTVERLPQIESSARIDQLQSKTNPVGLVMTSFG